MYVWCASQAVYNYATTACKCHGVSGSCSLRTCWHQLPVFRDISDRLLVKYDTAMSTVFNRHGTMLVFPIADRLPGDNSRQPTNRKKRRRNRKWRRGDDGGGGRRPSKDDLIFFERSPDYCLPINGSAMGGTVGRRCKRSSMSGEGGSQAPGLNSLHDGSCDVLCCGRGYNSYRETVFERCHCRFVWCCHVTCSTCRRLEDVHVCK